MTGEAYDHLMAAIVLGAIFIACVFTVPSISYINLLYIDQQQLQNVALSAMKTILFDEGYPNNWGSMHGTNMFNENDVKRFGLAATNAPSLYVLDPDKVYRLAYNPMGNISYQRARELLGLTGYGFSLIFHPLFNVSRSVFIEKINAGTRVVRFSANVSRYDGQPVPNAIVRATIIYASTSKGAEIIGASDVLVMTDALGKSAGSKTISIDGTIDSMIVFFRVTVAGRSTLVASSEDVGTGTMGQIAQINVVGDHVVFTLPQNAGSNDNRWITNILAYNFETSVSLFNGTGTGTSDDNFLRHGSGVIWDREFDGLDEAEPAIMICTFRTTIKSPDGSGSGRQLAVLIGPFGLWGQGGVMRFNDVPASSGATASIQRDVIIAGMAYIAELRLWKT